MPSPVATAAPRSTRRSWEKSSFRQAGNLLWDLHTLRSGLQGAGAAVLDRLDAECERSNWKHRDEEPHHSSEAPRTIHLGRIRDVLGSRAFGPILLVAGLFCVTPVGVIPGVPTMLALLVLMVSVQQVAGRDSLWLPSFIRDRELKPRRVATSVQIIRRVAGALDRILRPRLTWLVKGGGARVVGGLTAVMALLIPGGLPGSGAGGADVRPAGVTPARTPLVLAPPLHPSCGEEEPKQGHGNEGWNRWT